ncbi:hypothetical protein I302_100213 [Kwoniella bestiolae CBS 10118]|uniref:Signal recognition particle subunit SRP19 n=1 Tax=Kwoniella bestiolae CBS 10118 TaxID=1296100 RepID=A0A1B9G4I9_9TREE|nr:signal recognition particle subunit SRP19 [Kwoniella bestiolae CBS 10118]OCF25910.1 signal recognition particle subunit SRP19 [Kwoniella bestiolae CBS 10118]
MPTVEDYFDDDTDIPLPSSSKPRALPDTGLKGALLEEISDDEDGMDFSKLAEQSRGIFGEGVNAPPPPASTGNGKGKLVERSQDNELRPSGSGGPDINPNTPMGGFMGDMMRLQAAEDERLERLRKQYGNANVAKDPSVYKGWNTVYPLYFDAKVSINDGRRVPRPSSVWWPQASQIAQACRVLGLPSVLEPDRCHPADWENPGRVKVQIIKDGKFLNPIIKNRTQLYKYLSDQIRQRNPNIIFDPSTASSKRSLKPSPKQASKDDKNKKNPNKKSKSKSKSQDVQKKVIPPPKLPTRPPLAPQPIPVLDDRLPLHSPVVPAGVAVAAIKRDRENEKEAKKKGLSLGSADDAGDKKEKMPKMKRVVVRGKR